MRKILSQQQAKKLLEATEETVLRKNKEHQLKYVKLIQLQENQHQKSLSKLEG